MDSASARDLVMDSGSEMAMVTETDSVMDSVMDSAKESGWDSETVTG